MEDSRKKKEPTKEMLTRVQIQKNLKNRVDHLRIVYSVLFASFLVFLAILMLVIDNKYINIAIVAVYALLVIFTFVSLSDRMGEIKRGEFFVVRDKVVRVAKDEEVPLKRGFYKGMISRYNASIENNLYFANYGKYTVYTGISNSERITSVMEYTDVGDEFLIVIFRENPVCYFNTKLYEYEG